jgi:hypothetical protein
MADRRVDVLARVTTRHQSAPRIVGHIGLKQYCRAPELRGSSVKTRFLVLSPRSVLAVACSQSGNPPPTQLSGTNSVVASGSLLFITSTASNEIRVLDLQPPNIQTPVDYVRAPNPLSPLSIPTLSSPIDLATPTRYGPLGQPLTGDWLFARGAGSPAVSVMGALNCPQQLREFGRIVPRSDAVVTAMASRLSPDDTLAYLYLATFDGQESTLWEAVLPNLTRSRISNLVDPKTCPKYPGAMPACTLRAIAPIPGAVVTALVALPTVQDPGDDRAGPVLLPEEKRLVVATRLLAVPPVTPGLPTEDGVITVVDPTGPGSVSPFDLVFNPTYTLPKSYPVKKLMTHGNVVRVTFKQNGQDAGFTSDGLGIFNGTAEVVMDAGTRVFGLLDEASCSGSQDCVGILAVDLDRPAADGGYLPIAIDGEDNLVNLVDDAGVPVRDPQTNLIIRVADTYYRPPAVFDGGIPRDKNRMLPIRFGNGFGAGIFRDMVIQSSGLVQWFDGSQLPYGLLGVATISGNAGSNILAQIFVFDALSLRQLNFTPAPPVVSAQQAVLSDGAKAIFDGGPTDIVIGQGVWPFSETIFVLYEGIVAGVAGEPLDAGLGNPLQGVFPVSVNNRNAVEAFVHPNDIVVPVDSTNTECLYAFPILDNGIDGGVLWDALGALHPYPAHRARTLPRRRRVLVLVDGESLDRHQLSTRLRLQHPEQRLSDGPHRDGTRSDTSVGRSSRCGTLTNFMAGRTPLRASRASEAQLRCRHLVRGPRRWGSASTSGTRSILPCPRWSHPHPGRLPRNSWVGLSDRLRQRIRPRLGGIDQSSLNLPCAFPVRWRSTSGRSTPCRSPPRWGRTGSSSSIPRSTPSSISLQPP